MWKRLLTSTLGVGLLLAACNADESSPGSLPVEDGGVVGDGSMVETRRDAAEKDAGKTDANSGGDKCVGAGDDNPCYPGDGDTWICCGGACVSPHDSNHCRSCSEKCDAGEQCTRDGCAGSSCKPGRSGCISSAGAPGKCCDGSTACIDVETNPSHCGKCGNACTSAQVCVAGECLLADCTGAPGGASCLSATGYGACCGGVCTNTSTDAHCGSCGAACTPGASCVTQTCMGDAGVVGCGAANPCGPGKSCVQGRCVETICSGPGEEGFVCALATGIAGACCGGGGCKDLRSDRNHCGACGNACAAGDWCHDGACETKVTCAADNSGVACNLPNDEAGICCGGTCTNARTPQSCGACDSGCPSNATCRADGNCVAPDGDIAICGASNDCPAGRLCSAGRCLPSTCAAGASGGHCAFGRTTRGGAGTCYNGECVDTSQDKDACGKCGTTCASGLCAGGACVPPVAPCTGTCAPGEQCVDGTCVSACSVGALASFCAASTGALGVCCDKFFSTQCEDIRDSDYNCGGCGVRCPQGQTCQNGICSGASGMCKEGHQGAYCDLASGESKRCCGGACVDVTTDAKNCLGCGIECSFGQICDGGCRAP